MYFDSRLWGFTKGVRARIFGAVAIGILATGFGIARLALLGWLIAKVFQGAPLEELLLPFAGVAAVMLLRGGLEYLRTMVAHNTAAKVQVHLRTVIFDKVTELGPAHFGLERTGDAIMAMIDGVEQLEIYFGQYLPQLFISALTPFLIFGFVAFLDWPVAFVMLAAALITLIAPQIFHNWDQKNSLNRSRDYKAFAAEFLDSVQGLATLKAFGQSGARAKTLKTKADALFDSTMWVLATNSLARGITDTGIAVGAAATLALGAFRVVDGDMSLAALIMVLMLGVEVFRPLRDMRSLMHNGMVAQASAQTIFHLLDSKAIVTEGVTTGNHTLSPTVTFEDVTFAYPSSKRTAHEKLSFVVDAGERIGFVGPSGVGKSSIVRLLLRFYDPTQGAVRIGGKDLRELSFEELRSQIAVVNQDTYLFHGTVEDNLRIGKPDATLEEIAEACRAANAHEFVSQLPQGYRTVIGERGIRLSGGQRQRIAIARAILRDAPILVLDEALSAVDAENEAIIQDALDRLMQGRTTLIFAHRLSSVIDADRILVLDEGKVAETGTHSELMAKGGVYHRLMAEQAAETGRADAVIGGGGALATGESVTPTYSEEAQFAPTDAIVKAEGLGWIGAARELMKHIGPYKGKLGLTFFFGVTRVIAFIGIGVVSALAVKAVKGGDPFDMLLITLAVLAPVAGIFHWFESWIAHDMAFRLLAEMRIALFRKLDRLAPAYMVRRRTGDMVAMATHDVELVEYFFAHTIAPAFVAVLVPGLVVAALIFFGWQMAAALAPFLLIVALSPFFMRKRVDELGSRAREALGELNAHAVDTIQGLGEIIAFQRIPERRQELIDRTENHHRIRLPFFRDLTLQTSMLEVATGLGGLAVVIAGAGLIDAGALDSGILPLLTLLAMAAFLPISEIANVGRQLADTLGSTRRLYAVDSEPVPVTDGSGVVDIEDDGGLPITLDTVDFQYEAGNRRALHEAKFEVPAGKTVALVGPSGAGKTTIAHLLMRFWDPEDGAIRLGGHDLRDYALDDLRHRIALVAQDTYLFNDTLRANILIANPAADEAMLMQALERASLGDFVAGLPDGLGTMVGERGMRLSGGQRQRVSIARAFLKDAPVLILDEATSHLDAVNEKAVREALEELMADRTTIVIAHRLSTVRSADLIVALNEGKVIETGTHQELLAKGGLYAQLVAHQLAGAAGRSAAE
ncbi:MAG: thiol reductant ABC exporter subunit CydC [Alphaproteobacteria bacterium]|nr:thiol reductant ABC exporter subunit CydC [Alphaproteobacteria bacterium]